MPKEVEIAYPLLTRQWARAGGESMRLRPPGVKGVPDYLLVHPLCGNVLCEIKAVESMDDDIGLAVVQAGMLDTIRKKGGRAFALALHLGTRRWAGFCAGQLETTWLRNRSMLQWRFGLLMVPELTVEHVLWWTNRGAGQ